MFAQWIPFVATLGEGDAARPHMFFVPRDQVGIEIVNDWDGMGQPLKASTVAMPWRCWGCEVTSSAI